MNTPRIFNHRREALVAAPLCLALLGSVTSLSAQQPQIPTLQVCNVPTVVQGAGTVTIVARQPGGFTGSFTVQTNLQCDPNTGYPTGSLTISGISMNDSIEGTIVATTFEQLTSTGRATPTAYLNGRCSADSPSGPIPGCRYWIMFANNGGASLFGQGTPDIVSFLVLDKAGHRVAYGTGPVAHGHINVAPTPF